MVDEFVHEFTEKWQDRIELFEDFGDPARTEAYRRMLKELEQDAYEYLLETLKLQEAEEESGYSYSTLQKKVSEGEIPNAGEEGRPRIRRKDLPRKAAHSSLGEARSGEPDVLDILAG